MEEKLGGNIILSNFELDKQETIVAKKIIGNYAKKIRNLADYQELKIDMKVHEKSHRHKFEINAFLEFDGKKAVASEEGFNPYILINNILNNLVEEVKHKLQK